MIAVPAAAILIRRHRRKLREKEQAARKRKPTTVPFIEADSEGSEVRIDTVPDPETKPIAVRPHTRRLPRKEERR